MHVHHPARRIPRALVALSLGALLVVGCTATAAFAATSSKHHARSTSLAGTWSGRYSGAFSGTFRLHWKESRSRLSGTITLSSPAGTYGISGSVHGSAIQFGAVGAGATYTGSVSGKSMSGSYKSPQGGGTWSARKTS